MLVNLTPHTINFYNDKNELIYSVEPSGKVARLKTNTVVMGSYDITNGVTIPTMHTVFGKIENLPDCDYETDYIVSTLVALACKNRLDVFFQNDLVRDENGNIIGCRSLGRF